MYNGSGRNKFWRLLGPLIIFWALNMLAQFIITSFIMVGQMMPEARRIVEEYNLTFENLLNINYYVPPADAGEIARQVAIYTPYIVVFGGVLTIIYGVIIFRKDRKEEFLAGLSVKKLPKIWQYSLVIALAIVVCLGMNFILLMVQVAFPGLRYGQIASQVIFSPPFWFQLLGFGIITSVAEEYIFRGLIFKRYRENNEFIRSAIMTSLIFAVIHSNIIQFIYAFVLGLLCAYVYEKFGSLVAPIMLHIVANLTAITFTQLNGFVWFFEVPIRAGITVVLAAFIGASLVVLLRSIQIPIDKTTVPRSEL
jgi:membrane protease YdiL (CAAX protease family)